MTLALLIVVCVFVYLFVAFLSRLMWSWWDGAHGVITLEEDRIFMVVMALIWPLTLFGVIVWHAGQTFNKLFSGHFPSKVNVKAKAAYDRKHAESLHEGNDTCLVSS